jgi:hypothetical protein
MQVSSRFLTTASTQADVPALAEVVATVLDGLQSLDHPRDRQFRNIRHVCGATTHERAGRQSAPMSRHAAIRTHAWPLGRRRPRASLVKWVLLWFALSLGSAIGSSIVHPQTQELVCSAAGLVEVIVHTDDGVQELGAGRMDCRRVQHRR